MRKKKKIIEEKEEEIKEEVIVVEEKEIPDYYVLGIGETITDAANKFGLEVEKLKELNGDAVGGNQIKLK